MDNERSRRRFSKAKYAEIIKKRYHLMPTAELARAIGLTVKQIKNFVYRENLNRWARKDAATLSRINSEKGKKRRSTEEKSLRKKAKPFFLLRNFRYFAIVSQLGEKSKSIPLRC